MNALAQDAQRISLPYHCGVIAGGEVIAWADAVIVEMPSPPDALIVLSTTPLTQTGDIASILHRLSAGADFWMAFRRALPQLRDYVVSRRDRAEDAANHLFLTACSFGVPDAPDDLHFVYRFDDAFSLARQGIYGDLETVYRGLVRELDRITSP